MSDTVIQVNSVSKRYRLGMVGTGTLSHDLNRWWAQLRGRPDPTRKIDEIQKAETRKQKPEHSEKEILRDDEMWALKDVSFEVKRGEVLGIIGRNGAGKSTLLKILSRVTAPTSGEIRIKGRIASLLEVGTGFHPELTGRENIFLNGAILGMQKKEIASKFDEIVAFAELDKFVDTPVKRYSSGMYVRLAFAVAAHLEPEILLIDEVLAVGDASFQKKCLGKMGEVAQHGRTILFISHNMVAVRGLCQKVICLDSGRIHKQGDSSSVINDYLQTGITAVMEKRWDDRESAPGNEKVRLMFACVRKETPESTGIINVGTPIRLYFEIWNNRPNMVINFTTHIYTAEGIYVLATGSDIRPRHKGLVRASMKIPANFLNDQIYNVSLQIVKDGTETVCLYQNLLGFEVHDNERERLWHGKWPGVIRPQMEWNTEDVGSSSEI
jgi:lipopolysaccharide transport system ATP-binding protein